MFAKLKQPGRRNTQAVILVLYFLRLGDGSFHSFAFDALV